MVIFNLTAEEKLYLEKQLHDYRESKRVFRRAKDAYQGRRPKLTHEELKDEFAVVGISARMRYGGIGAG